MTKTQEEKNIQPHPVEEILNKSMSSSIWKDLPPEMLENVLACLPVHVLCRFRLVCKNWNHLISQPSFAMLRALSPRKASSIFISPRAICGKMTTSSKWHVLDLMEKRSYKLSDSFIVDSYLSSSRNKELKNTNWHFHGFKYTLAADGELIYTMYLPLAWPTRPQMHIVCNPLTKSFHEIPEFPEFQGLYNQNIIVMSVDNATQTYKIVTMELYLPGTKSRSQNLFLYESVTSTWRKICEAPSIGLFVCSGIFMRGIFYTLFVDFTDISFRGEFYTLVLYSCDLVTGAWYKINVDFPLLSADAEENPQLVVSLGQMYMVRFTKCRTQKMSLSIWKIVVETKEVVQVARLPNFFKFSKEMIQLSKLGVIPVVVGCADSIIISCKEELIKFNLLEKSWQELPCVTWDKGIDIMSRGICAYLVDF